MHPGAGQEASHGGPAGRERSRKVIRKSRAPWRTIQAAIERYRASWGRTTTRPDFKDSTLCRLFAAECAREVNKAVKENREKSCPE